MSQEKIKNRIDHKMLVATLSIQTTSGDDDAMVVYIRDYLKTLNVTVQEDDFGNIYVTKGKSKNFPCIIAHTDTVHSIVNPMEIYKTGDTLFSFDPSKKHQCGIGGDDKVGVYVLLQMLTDVNNIKAVFYREEEIGCKGSRYSILNHRDWYKDCGYIIAADRRGNKDVITISGGVLIASDEYLEATEEIHNKYNYEEIIGICSDVDTLVSNDIGISCVNYSSGYHEPHSHKETVSISDVNRCYNLMFDIIKAFPDKRFNYIAPKPTYKSKYKGFARQSYSNVASLVGPNMPINKRQGKFRPPLDFSHKTKEFENFIEIDVLRSNKKIYSYIGVKAVVFTGDMLCDKCKTSVANNFYYLPFEGKIYCSSCNDYVEDTKIDNYLQFLEVDDKGQTFVYSLYSNGWLLKKHSLWNSKITSWVPDEMPF